MAISEQYFRLAIGFASIAFTSRLLTPGEVGVAVIGTGIIAIALGLREFATSDFLIQRQEVERDDVRTSFTVLFLLTALIASTMFLLAPWLGTFYGEDKLARFLRVAAVAGLIEAVALPITGLLRRDMAFGALAVINITSATVMTASTVLLAFVGFSYMSFAWAAVAGAATTTVLAFRFRPDLSNLHPTLKSWRSVLSFGGYNGVSFVVNRTYEALPQLVLGHVLSHSAVGLYSRATLLSDIPDKIVLSSVFSVAFPALAAEIRRGGSLKEAYLRALSLITVFYWPGQVLLVLLAYPIVSLLLGQQWLGVVPLLQILAIATFAWFPVMLTSPVLLAIGANRDRVLADLVGRSVSAVILCSAAWFGIMAMAASKIVTLPFQMVVSFCFVRRHVSFRWGELGAALWRSMVVTAGSGAGPIGVVALSDTGFELSATATVVAVLSAGVGWLVAVLLTRHPVSSELRNALGRIAKAPSVRRLRVAALSPRAGEAR
jgi:O-antigen/teichoic acid export membrane protein